MKGKIFNAQEVQALLNGSKVMFREVIKVQPLTDKQQFGTIACSSNSRDKGKHQFINPDDTRDRTELFKCPYQVGQKIFCKEVFCKSIFGKAIYKDEEKEIRGLGHKELSAKWKPAQHMKQEHSRLTLLIKEIRVERLASISRDDVWNEGWSLHPDQIMGLPPVFDDSGKERDHTHKDAFAVFWNATHKKPKEKFEASPWVFVYTVELKK